MIDALVAAGTLAVASYGIWIAMSLREELITRQLRFSPDLTRAQVVAVLETIASLPRSEEVRFIANASGGRTQFWLSASKRNIALLDNVLNGYAPGIRIEESGEPTPIVDLPNRRRLWWAGKHVLLREDTAESSSAALLGIVSGATPLKTVQFQIGLESIGSRRPHLSDSRATTPSSRATAMTKKYSGHCLRMWIETGTDYESSSSFVSQIRAALTTRNGLRGRLISSRSSSLVSFATALNPSAFSTIVSPAELVSLLPLPVGAPNIPGVEYGVATRLLPPHTIGHQKTGRAFGVSNWPGQESTQLIQPTAGAKSHSLLIGPSGSGKSWLLASLFLQDISNGHGALLLDMKGDTVADILSRVDERRRDDVVVLEPAAGNALPGLRSFGDQPELAADLWLQVFRGLFPESFGVRSQRYLRMGCRTLAACDRTATILDLPRLFEDSGYRPKLVSRLDDPLLAGEWATFEQMSTAQKAEHVMSPLGKVNEVISRRNVRAVLGQPSPKTTIANALAERKIVLVSLPAGTLGQPAAQLLGALVIFEAWQAIMSRQSTAADQRPYIGLYVDEPAVLGNLPLPLDTLFETARGMGCGITLAAQSMKQLPPRVAHAALANSGTIAAFRPAHTDAKLLADELPGVTADQLQLLDPFTLALRLGMAPSETAPVTTAKTLPLCSPIVSADEMRSLSAERYGLDASDVDKRLRERLGVRAPGQDGPTDEVVLGDRRRAS